MEKEIKVEAPSIKKEQIGIDITKTIISKAGVEILSESSIANKESSFVELESIEIPKK